MTFRYCASLVLCEEAGFNETVTWCFSLRRKIQGWSGTRTPVELVRAQAHTGWKDLMDSVPCHGQSWRAMDDPMVGYTPLAVCKMKLRNLWENINFYFPFWLLCRGLQPGHRSGKRQSQGGEEDTSLQLPNHFGTVLSPGSSPWLCPIIKQMFLFLFLRLRMDMNHMQFLRRQQETESFDPARTRFSSSACALVYVPWAAISTRGYLHPSTCKKGVSDQPRHLLLI